MSDQFVDRQSKVTPSEKGPVEATRSERVPPRTSEIELDNLVHFRQHAQKAGLSERTANMAAKCLRIGTRDTYNSLLYCVRTDSINGAGRNRLIQPWHLYVKWQVSLLCSLTKGCLSPQLEVTDQLLQLSIQALIKRRQSLTLYFFPLMRAFFPAEAIN